MQSKTKLMEVLENKANGSCVSVCGGSIAVFGVVGKCEGIVLYHASLNLQFGMFLDYNSGFCFFFFFSFQHALPFSEGYKDSTWTHLLFAHCATCCLMAD